MPLASPLTLGTPLQSSAFRVATKQMQYGTTRCKTIESVYRPSYVVAHVMLSIQITIIY